MGRITKCGCYLVVPGFFSHERHTGGLRWWAMGRRLPSFTGFSKPSSCVESGTEHLAKGNGVVSFWLTNLIAAWPRRNLEPGRSIATIFVGLLFFFFRKMVPIQFSRHATLTARYAFFFCWFCLFVCVLFSFDQGRHTKTGQLAAIKVMDVTEVKQQKNPQKKRNRPIRCDVSVSTWTNSQTTNPIDGHFVFFEQDEEEEIKLEINVLKKVRHLSFLFLNSWSTKKYVLPSFYWVFLWRLVHGRFRCRLWTLARVSTEFYRVFILFQWMEIVWLGFTEFLAQFDRFYRFFLPSFPWNLHLESVMDLVTF